MIENAGKLSIPFTTGILLGIGETMDDREESLRVICDLHRRYGHIQEVIVQNFCPKPGTPMADAAVPGTDEICATISLAREILPADVAVQIPPNLVDASCRDRVRGQRPRRNLPADHRLRQPRAPLAADRGTQTDCRGRRTPRTPLHIPAVHREGLVSSAARTADPAPL